MLGASDSAENPCRVQLYIDGYKSLRAPRYQGLSRIAVDWYYPFASHRGAQEDTAILFAISETRKG